MDVTEVATGRVLGRLPVPCTGGLAVSPDGTRLFTSNADSTISVWDLPALEAKYLPVGPVGDYWAALASADPTVGCSAVRRLAADPKAVDWLRECYAKPRATVPRALHPYQPWAGLTLDQVRDVRAVEVLERIGTAEAKDLLGTWVKHESAVLRLEAAAALARLGQKR